MDNRPDPVTAQAALDFVLWLNGAMDVLSDTPPTQDQWDKIRGKVGEQVAAIVAQRIRKAAEPMISTATQSGLTPGKTYTASSLTGTQQAIFRTNNEVDQMKRQNQVTNALAGKSATKAIIDEMYDEYGYVEYTKS